jgi:hypothetical protein
MIYCTFSTVSEHPGLENLIPTPSGFGTRTMSMFIPLFFSIICHLQRNITESGMIMENIK